MNSLSVCGFLQVMFMLIPSEGNCGTGGYPFVGIHIDDLIYVNTSIQQGTKFEPGPSGSLMGSEVNIFAHSLPPADVGRRRSEGYLTYRANQEVIKVYSVETDDGSVEVSTRTISRVEGNRLTFSGTATSKWDGRPYSVRENAVIELSGKACKVLKYESVQSYWYKPSKLKLTACTRCTLIM